MSWTEQLQYALSGQQPTKGGEPVSPERVIEMTKPEFQKNDAEEKRFQESVKQQYVCTKYCRCCPFPGLKCVESGHPVR